MIKISEDFIHVITYDAYKTGHLYTYLAGSLTFNVGSVGHVHTARNLCLFRAQIFVSLHATMQASNTTTGIILRSVAKMGFLTGPSFARHG